MSSVASSVIAGGPSPFWSLRPAGSAGRQSATAAAITTTSAPSAAPRTASRISAAVSIRTTAAPAGASRLVGPVTSVTAAPRRAASAATS